MWGLLVTYANSSAEKFKPLRLTSLCCSCYKKCYLFLSSCCTVLWMMNPRTQQWNRDFYEDLTKLCVYISLLVVLDQLKQCFCFISPVWRWEDNSWICWLFHVSNQGFNSNYCRNRIAENINRKVIKSCCHFILAGSMFCSLLQCRALYKQLFEHETKPEVVATPDISPKGKILVWQWPWTTLLVCMVCFCLKCVFKCGCLRNAYLMPLDLEPEIFLVLKEASYGSFSPFHDPSRY